MIDQTLAPDTTAQTAAPRRRPSRGFPRGLEVALVWGLIAVLTPQFLAGSHLFLATTLVIYALFALGVNILFGWTGISSFGQAAFFGAGAYTAGLLKDAVDSPILVILLAALVAGILAFTFAAISTRVTGVGFAMLTLVFGQILWLLTFRVDPLGGENGIPGVPRGEIFGENMFKDKVFWWFVLAVVAVGTYLLRRLSVSTLGMSMNAVRDDPVRAAALGINVRLVRIVAFSLAGVTAGVAGGLYAKQQGLVSPEALAWTLSGEVIVMCLVGGLHRFWGPVVGAALLVFANWYLFDRVASPLLYVGLVLLLIVLLLPEGIAGIPALVRKRLRGKGDANAHTA